MVTMEKRATIIKFCVDVSYIFLWDKQTEISFEQLLLAETRKMPVSIVTMLKKANLKNWSTYPINLYKIHLQCKNEMKRPNPLHFRLSTNLASQN